MVLSHISYKCTVNCRLFSIIKGSLLFYFDLQLFYYFTVNYRFFTLNYRFLTNLLGLIILSIACVVTHQLSSFSYMIVNILNNFT